MKELKFLKNIKIYQIEPYKLMHKQKLNFLLNLKNKNKQFRNYNNK